MMRKNKRIRSKARPATIFEQLEARNLLATFTVNTFADVVDSGDGLLSLREAILDANSNGEDDQIVLSNGTYEISIEGRDEDGAATGDFDILSDSNHSLTLIGDSQNGTVIDANGLDRIFQAHGDSTFTVQELTLRNGDVVRDEGLGRRGGNIWSGHADLTLDGVTIEDTQLAGLAAGGGVYIAGGNYRIENSLIQNNAAQYQGSALFVRGADGEFVNTSIRNNDTNSRAAVLHFVGGSYRFDRSEITDNHTDNFNSSRVPILHADNADGEIFLSTFTNNTSRLFSQLIYADGGSLDVTRTRLEENAGAVVVATDAQLNFDHSRFLRNQGRALASTDSTVVVHDSRITLQTGGGILSDGETGSLNVTESFFLHNNFVDISFSENTLLVDGTEFVNQPVSPPQNGTYGHAVFVNQAEDIEAIQIFNSTFSRYGAGFNSQSPIQIEKQDEAAAVTSRVVLDQVSFDESSNIRLQGGDIVLNQVQVDGLRDTDQFVIEADSLEFTNSTISNINTFVRRASTVVTDSVFENGHGLVLNQIVGDIFVSDSVFRNGDGGIRVGDSPDAGRLDVIRTEIVESGLALLGTNDTRVSNSVIRDNSTNNVNVGIIGLSPTFDGSTPQLTITNSVVSGNTSLSRGTIVTGNNGNVTIQSSTFANNSNSGQGTVVYVNSSAPEIEVSVFNSIIWGNSPRDDLFFNVPTLTVQNSAIEDADPDDGDVPFGGATNGNIDDQPFFVDLPGGDFRILAGSPTIDSGDNSLLARDVYDSDNDGDLTDFEPDRDLLDRIVGGLTDIGAFEFQG